MNIIRINSIIRAADGSLWKVENLSSALGMPSVRQIGAIGFSHHLTFNYTIVTY